MKKKSATKPLTLGTLAQYSRLPKKVLRSLGSQLAVDGKYHSRLVETSQELSSGRRKRQSPSTHKSFTIGYIIPARTAPYSDPFYSELWIGIANEAVREGIDILTCAQPPGPDEMGVYQRWVDQGLADGFLVVDTRFEDPRLEFLSKEGIPCVAFGKADPRWDVPTIDVDAADGIVQITQILIDMGHRRIAFVGGSLNSTFVSDRLAGFQRALEQNKIRLDPELVAVNELSMAGGRLAGNYFLHLRNPPTAIVCGSDAAALGVMYAARENDLDVGDDISVTGFDDSPLAERVRPTLTTVRQPLVDIGRQLCLMLGQLVRGETLEERQIVFQPSVVMRESARRPRARRIHTAPPRRMIRGK